MPGRQMPMKDVVHCEKPRGAVCKRNIRGYPNGETPRGDKPRDQMVEHIDHVEGTRGTETSQYLQEKREFSE